MYLVDNCDALFTLPSGAEVINCVAANRDRRFVVVVTDDTLYFYYISSHLLLCCFKRAKDEVIDRGSYKKLYWRNDSRSICVITSSNYVYVYTVDFSDDVDCFNLHDSSEESMVRQSPEFYLKQRRPIVDVSLSVVAKLENEANCVISLNDELFICLSDGWIHRLGWNGDVFRDFAINIRNVPFFVDQITAKSPQRILEKISFPTAYVVDCAYCPLVGGICVVLNDGRAALLVSRTPEFRPTETSAVWAIGMKDACCCAVNHEFRLIYFGCKNGDVAGYTINDANGSLVQVMRTRMMVKNGTEYLDRITSVRQIQCLSQVVAVIWNVKPPKEKESCTVDDAISLSSLNLNDTNGVSKGVVEDHHHSKSAAVNGSVAETSSIRTTKSSTRRSSLVSSVCPPALAIFSPFGAQWWCSFESCLQNGFNHHNYTYSCMDWSPEGYQLWLGATGLGLLTLNFVRSLPDFFERVVMIGNDRVYLSPSKMHEVGATAPHFVLDVCKVPHDYISANWPIRYVGLDEECRVLAVAGRRGFCFCTVKNLKWRLFRKESQEDDLCLTANIVVYKEFILVSACDANGASDFLYAFNVHEQLDRDLARVVRAVDRILLMNHQNDHMLTFDVTSTVRIYALCQKYPMTASNEVSNGTSSHQQLQKTSLEINCLAEIRVGELLPDPFCVISIQLSQLCYHSDSAEFCPGFDSLLLNVSGHLFMLSPRRHNSGGSAPSSPPIVTDRNGLNGLLDANGSGGTSENGVGEPSFKLHPPTLIASNVERVWMHSTRRDIPHLSRALWINAGCRRMQIWLPLSQQKPSLIGDEEPPHMRNGFRVTKSFISKRIMLPIDLNLYALVIDDDCLACGAESFTTAGTTTIVENSSSFYGMANGGVGPPSSGVEATSSTCSTTITAQRCNIIPNSNPSVLVHSLMRTTEVFLHRLLRQLLMRNLGAYALAIASACRSLPYFSHILELLLHDVLEEEATSSEPIPDPLLPTIVSFISEFPEYLQTIVHCARKTELAFWNMLFSASHHPREILRICLEDGDLDTAARCLILLQSMEPALVSVQFALHLLEEATNKQRWTLARDIVRFMRRIDRADFDNNPEILRLIRNVVEHNPDMLHEEVALNDGGGRTETGDLHR